MSDDEPRPKWFGTARGRRGQRTAKAAKPPKPARAARISPRVFSELPEEEQAGVLVGSSWACEPGRMPDGTFAPGNQLAPDRRKIISGMVVKRRFNQIIAENHPTLLQETVAELARIALYGDTDNDRLAAIKLIHDRTWGRPREHKTVKRVGGPATSLNIAMFGADGARILEAVKSPEDRQRLAAEIHQWQLEQSTEGSTDGEGDGSGDGTEVCSGPGFPLS